MQIIKIKTITVWNNTRNQIQHCTTTACKKPDPTQICPLLYNFPCEVLKMHYLEMGLCQKTPLFEKKSSLCRVVSLHGNTENSIINLQGSALGPRTLGPQHTVWSPQTGQVFLRQIPENPCCPTPWSSLWVWGCVCGICSPDQPIFTGGFPKLGSDATQWIPREHTEPACRAREGGTAGALVPPEIGGLCCSCVQPRGASRAYRRKDCGGVSLLLDSLEVS